MKKLDLAVITVVSAAFFSTASFAQNVVGNIADQKNVNTKEVRELSLGASMLDFGTEHAIEERELFGLQMKYMFATPVVTKLGSVRGGFEASFATQNNVDASNIQRFDQDFFTLGFAQSVDFNVPGMLKGLTPSIDSGIGMALDYTNYYGSLTGDSKGIGAYAKLGASVRYKIESLGISPFLAYSYTYSRMLSNSVSNTDGSSTEIGSVNDPNSSINQLQLGVTYQF